jgi:hypothetical protein
MAVGLDHDGQSHLIADVRGPREGRVFGKFVDYWAQWGAVHEVHSRPRRRILGLAEQLRGRLRTPLKKSIERALL